MSNVTFLRVHVIDYEQKKKTCGLALEFSKEKLFK